MTDLNTINLIDLSLEGDNSFSKQEIKNESGVKFFSGTSHFLPYTWDTSDNVEKKILDCEPKLPAPSDDPFDIVETQVSSKAQQSSKAPIYVKMGDLLSLSDYENKQSLLTPDTEELIDLNVDIEIPSIVQRENGISDILSELDSDSTLNKSAQTSSSAKLRKKNLQSKRLLQLSLSNSAFGSPNISRQCLESEDMFGTPISLFSEAVECEEQLIVAESPLKLVADDDLVSEDISNFADSEKKFEADLEMLKIPILNELSSTAVEQVSVDSLQNSPKSSVLLENVVPHLQAIKANLKAKEKKSDSHQMDISSLIQNLRTLISSGEMVDNDKKKQVNELLESLTSALKPYSRGEMLKTSDVFDVQPQTTKRECIFDMDLPEKVEANNDDEPLVQDISNCMTSSSATYDGEAPNHNLNLPKIAPLSPPVSPSETYQNVNIKDCEKNCDSNVNNIVEQLSKLSINNSTDCKTNHNNPTFIVVMNTSQLSHSNIHSNQNAVEAKLRSIYKGNYVEESGYEGSPDLTQVNSMARRRSQSLSLHDKVNIVQVSTPFSTFSTQKQPIVHLDLSPSNSVTPLSDKEFKTADRLRRSSYSSGTPFTAPVGMRRSGVGCDKKQCTKMRRSLLDTHGESQRKSIVGSVTIPSNNLLTFKPDLKRKTNHCRESIIKSSAPLKATIPVKKITLKLKTSPLGPEKMTKYKPIVAKTPLRTKADSTLGESVGFPNACSTPSTFVTPLKRTTGLDNRYRRSYSATPISKSLSTNCGIPATLKRRTITELKSKSAVKPRVNSTCLASPASTSSSRVSAGSLKLSASSGISKTAVKTSAVSIPSVKPTSRLSSRASVSGSLQLRNKENKRP